MFRLARLTCGRLAIAPDSEQRQLFEQRRLFSFMRTVDDTQPKNNLP